MNADGFIADMKRIKEMVDAMPAPIVLVQAPVARGAFYVETRPGALVQMKERVRVAFIHRDDLPAVQAAHVDAGFPPLRVVTGEDMRPWMPEPLGGGA